MNYETELKELVGQMSSGDEDNLISASVMLGQFGKSAVAPLICLLTDPRPLVREYSAMSLGIVGKDASDATQALLPLLKDASDAVRYAAVVAIGKIGLWDGVVEQSLREVLSDPDAMVARGAAEALSGMRGT